MQDFKGKKILLGVCGGIAAYKAAYLVRELSQLGADVRVILTQSAQQFITPLTMQALSGHDVRCEIFDEQAERAMGHIELARWADYLVIAPATANCLAKLAHGLADDLLSTLYLVLEKPVIICPAMNKSMWQHPSTQANYQALKQRGVIFVDPEEGSQACGEIGLGRLSDIELIINALRLYGVNNKLSGKKVLITAGTTQEPLDPVRYIGNRSSGRMGFALAQAALMAGAEVSLVTGPCDLPLPAAIKRYSVTTAQQMHDKVMNLLESNIIFIGCAAVADYAAAHSATEKIKKNDQELTISLIRNPDILAKVAATGKARFVMGFAAETNDVIENARLKLKNKRLDMIVANQVGENLGFNTDDNQVTVLTSSEQIDIPLDNKVRLAAQLIAILAVNLQNSEK